MTFRGEQRHQDEKVPAVTLIKIEHALPGNIRAPSAAERVGDAVLIRGCEEASVFPHLQESPDGARNHGFIGAKRRQWQGARIPFLS